MAKRAGTLAFLLLLLGGLLAAPAQSVPAYTALGSDEAGDATSDMTDLRGLEVRRTKAGISVRMHFEDLPEVVPAGPFALWRIKHSGRPRRECCQVRVNFGPQPELLFTYRPDRCSDCWRTLDVKGRYNADDDTVTFFVPLTIAPFGVGDVISGCPPADEDGMCDGWGPSASTSPASYGDDQLTTRGGFRIR